MRFVQNDDAEPAEDDAFSALVAGFCPNGTKATAFPWGCTDYTEEIAPFHQKYRKHLVSQGKVCYNKG